ncbi:MAG: sensor histidine kinase [Bacteroidia bacterium]
MKKPFPLSTYQWIVVLTTIILGGLVVLQTNYILEAHQLKSEQIHQRLMDLVEPMAIEVKGLKKDSSYRKVENHVLIAEVVNRMAAEGGFDTEMPFAILQTKEDGYFTTPDTEYEAALKSSPYRACLTCIVTIQFLSDSSKLPESEMTSMRTVEQTETEIPGKPGRAEFYWLSIHLPHQGLLIKKEIIGFFLLTALLTVLLVAVFAYILRSLSKQKKLNQAKDDFFNNLTHEFMTPLSSIRLAARVIKGQLSEEKLLGYLDLIERESHQLEGQVDKILQLSLLESQENSIDRRVMDLHEAIQAVEQRLQLHIEQQAADLHLDLNLADSRFEGDFDHLVNGIFNLVDNALKYAGPKPSIWIRTYAEGTKQNISVRDNGPGIPKEEHTEIFERFYRSQQNDQYKGKGFGIGLSYVKTIVEAHGGTLILNPAYEQGCEFIISL